MFFNVCNFNRFSGRKSVPFFELAAAMKLAGADDYTIEDAECVAQALIDQNFMKGYLSHGNQVV
jgi:hypothetical protein